MKKALSFILAILMILSTLAFAVSCGDSDADTDSSANGDDTSANTSGGTQNPPSNSNGGGDSSKPVFLPNDNDSTDPADIKTTSRALLSSVRVVAHFERYLGYGQTSLSKTDKESAGVIYKLDREAGNAYIITNFHAIYLKDAVSPNHVSDNIEIFLYGQESQSYAIKATYVGGSLAGEVAVLKVTGSEVIKHSHASAVTPADSNELRVFDSVFAIGNPADRGLAATNVIVSVENDNISILGADGKTTIQLRTIRTNAVLGEDENSGGGLFNKNGGLVGILVPKTSGDNINNMSYAIPSNVATRIADILIEAQATSVTVGYKKYQLGITMESSASGVIIDELTGAATKIEQIRISAIQDSSPLSGFAQVGDIITAISVDNGDEMSVIAMHNVIEEMLKARLGSKVTLTIQRDGEYLTKTVTVTESMLTPVA